MRGTCTFRFNENNPRTKWSLTFITALRGFLSGDSSKQESFPSERRCYTRDNIEGDATVESLPNRIPPLSLFLSVSHTRTPRQIFLQTNTRANFCFCLLFPRSPFGLPSEAERLTTRQVEIYERNWSKRQAFRKPLGAPLSLRHFFFPSRFMRCNLMSPMSTFGRPSSNGKHESIKKKKSCR